MGEGNLSPDFWARLKQRLRRYTLCPACRGNGVLVIVGATWWERHVCGEESIQRCPCCHGDGIVYLASGTHDDAPKAA